MSSEVGLRRYFEALLAEKDRAVAMADDERDRAALALRAALERTISEGDDRLREHITAQAQQIHAALVSADKLELARIDAVHGELEAAVRSAADAIEKAEAAYDKRFESVNEWRAQSLDRERSSAEERAKLQSTFMLKEVGESNLNQMRKFADQRYESLREQLDALSARLDVAQGELTGARRVIVDRRAGVNTNTQILMAVVAVLTVLVVIATATHGFSATP